MTRAFFLFLSQNKRLRNWMEKSSQARGVTRRFIAGETLEEELSACEALQRSGILTTIDHLGENVTTLAAADAARDMYLRVLDEIAARGLPATIALKLTALGLDQSQEACVSNLNALAAKAAAIGTRVEIDMEDTRYTERTVHIAERAGAEFGCLRVAIQAYLYRSSGDIKRLSRAGVSVRLCKGAYIEPAALAMPRKADVDRSYVALMSELLDSGIVPALATHDERMIDAILSRVRERALSADRFEFEMLHGIRRDLQHKLASQGFRVRVYVPFGREWYHYFMRRLAERPANVWFLARNLFK